ncbi:MAG: hypothetical protein OJF49_002266 [Ktedonobacterales bacterium]|jgi:hypothetical protein|nr:MAG: hypothetical protein OJF49_002266 [Ktedonobacterales bacterium]
MAKGGTMRRGGRVSALVWVMALASLAGCAQMTQQTQQPTLNTPKVVYIAASWAQSYRDVKSLKRDADIAVAGTIASMAGTSGDAVGVVATDFVFSISRAIYNPHGQTLGATITLHQTGDTISNTPYPYEMEDDPLFQPGEQLVLFLHEYSAGHYYVIGGPTGRFEVRSGVVLPATGAGVQLAPSTSLDAFVTMIQQA